MFGFRGAVPHPTGGASAHLRPPSLVHCLVQLTQLHQHVCSDWHGQLILTIFATLVWDEYGKSSLASFVQFTHGIFWNWTSPPKYVGPNLKWLRYVDDVFMIWQNDLDFDSFFNLLIQLHPTINFKYEWEGNGKLSFLDTKIHKGKPTTSYAYIHYYSAHHKNIKTSVTSSMFLRAYRICSPMYLRIK